MNTPKLTDSDAITGGVTDVKINGLIALWAIAEGQNLDPKGVDRARQSFFRRAQELLSGKGEDLDSVQPFEAVWKANGFSTEAIQKATQMYDAVVQAEPLSDA